MLTDRDYELLSNYLDDALDSTERADLETRLNGELELQRELEALRSTVALINALPPRKAPRNFTLDANMARRPAAPRRRFFSPVLVSALSAAAAVLLIGFGLLSLTAHPNAAPAEISFGAQAQQGIAQVPTENPLLKTDDGILTLENADASPELGALSGTIETDTNDLFDQTSGAGGESTSTRDQQDNQQLGQQSLPIAPGAPIDTVVVPEGTLYPAPFFALPTDNETLDGFTIAAPPAMESSTLEEYSAQTGVANSASLSDQAALAPTNLVSAQRTNETPTQAASATFTPTPSETPTNTPVPPTLTPAPTAIPASESATTVELVPLVSLGAGIILLLVALAFYLRSRRSA